MVSESRRMRDARGIAWRAVRDGPCRITRLFGEPAARLRVTAGLALHVGHALRACMRPLVIARREAPKRSRRAGQAIAFTMRRDCFGAPAAPLAMTGCLEASALRGCMPARSAGPTKKRAVIARSRVNDATTWLFRRGCRAIALVLCGDCFGPPAAGLAMTRLSMISRGRRSGRPPGGRRPANGRPLRPKQWRAIAEQIMSAWSISSTVRTIGRPPRCSGCSGSPRRSAAARCTTSPPSAGTPA